jgi:hypothetical protein
MALTKITTSVIAANTLGTANIADNSIDATKIAANSILTRHIDDDQITGDQLADDITIAGNLTVTGNLVTNGASVTNSSTNTTIEDNLIELGTGTTGSPSSDSGIVIERGDSDNAFIGWDESEDKFILGTGSFTGASTGNLTISTAPLVVGALTASGLSFPTSDGTNGQVLKTDGSGSLTFGDNTTKVDNYTATGDGSTTAFDTGINPGSEVNTWIFIDGVYQQKSEYSYSGSTVTFTTAPQNGALIDVITGTSSNITASDTVLGVYEATTTSTDTYATGISASNENNTWVFVGGVYQPKDSYTFSSGTLTFDANTPTGQKLSVVATKTITAGAVDTSTLAANAVTSAKIASNSILSRHIANNSIVGADISATTQITASTFTGALTGDVTGNVVGNLTGTIQTAAQTNITSVGTLTALDVAATATMDGLTVDGNAEISSTVPILKFMQSDGTDQNAQLRLNSNAFYINQLDDDGTTNRPITLFNVATGDVSFYEDTGTTAKLYWDASAESLGIGTTSPSDKLHVVGKARIQRATNANLSLISDNNTGANPYLVGTNSDTFFIQNQASSGFGTGGNFIQYNEGGSLQLMGVNYIDSSGNVGIGTDNPAEILHVSDTSTAGAVGLRAENSEGHVNFTTNGGGFQFETSASGTVAVIDSSGNVGIGTSSPVTGIDVKTTNYTYSGTTYDIYGIVGLTSGGVRLGGDSSNSDSVIGTTGTGNLQFVTYNGSAWGSRMTLTNSGNVLIGEQSGDPFNSDSVLRLQKTGQRVFQQFKTDTDQQAAILFGDVADDVRGSIEFDNNTDDMYFATGNNTEAVRILSTGGITFNGDTATANALDDYEEGTWRPTIAGQTSAGTYTYGENAGVYTKIGNQVTCTFYIVDITEVSAGSGNLAIDNFPFSAANVTAGTIVDYYWGSCALEHFNVNNATINIAVGMDAGSTRCLFWETLDANVNGLVQVTDLSSSGAADIWGQVTYRTI